MVYRTAPFAMTLNDPYRRFQGYGILWRWIYRKRHEVHSFNGILMDLHTPYSKCHFEWPRVTLSDLAKYSMTRVARGLSATAKLLVVKSVTRVTAFLNQIFMKRHKLIIARINSFSFYHLCLCLWDLEVEYFLVFSKYLLPFIAFLVF